MPAELDTVVPAGIPRDQLLDGDEVVIVERLAVRGLPEILDIADRRRGEAVDLAAVAVLDVARRFLRAGTQPRRPVDGGHACHFERIVEDGDGGALHRRRA